MIETRELRRDFTGVRAPGGVDLRVPRGTVGLVPAVDAVRRALSVPVERADDLVRVIRALDAAEVAADAMTVAEPTLDDVYLAVARDTAAVGRGAANGVW